MSLGPLRGTLAGAIQTALPDIHLDYDQAAIEWSRDQGRVNLVVQGTRLYDARGRVVARAPKAAIGLAAAPFLRGKFVVKRITLVGVEFTLVHMKNGRIRLGAEKDAGDDDIIGRLSDVIDARGSESSSLESFAVRDARLGIYDEVTGLHVTSPRANLVLHSKGETIGTSFDADVMISGSKSHVTADFTLPPAKGPILGNVNVTGLDLRALGRDAQFFDGVKQLPVIASISTSFRLDPGAVLANAKFDVTAHGDIPFAALKDKALHIEHLRLIGAYDGGTHHLVLGIIDLKAREARAGAERHGRLLPGGRQAGAGCMPNWAAATSR